MRYSEYLVASDQEQRATGAGRSFVKLRWPAQLSLGGRSATTKGTNDAKEDQQRQCPDMHLSRIS